MLKKIAFSLACLILCLSLSPELRAEKKLLCSTFPVYLFTGNIAQGVEGLSVDLLVDSKQGCPHDYSLTPNDLERLSRADVLIINGLGLESFLAKAATVVKPGLRVIDASGGGERAGKNLSLIVRGVEALNDMVHDDHSDHDGHDHGHQHGLVNPHIFAAPGPASEMVSNIAAGLAALDSENADIYNKNASNYVAELQKIILAGKEAGKVLGSPKIIASHSIFDYLAEDLELTIAAAIEEVDGADPSPARLAELIRVAKSQNVRAILVDPQGNINLARTLGAETGLPVAVIDPVASGPLDAPLDYYQKVMSTDLEVLLKLFQSSRPEAEKK